MSFTPDDIYESLDPSDTESEVCQTKRCRLTACPPPEGRATDLVRFHLLMKENERLRSENVKDKQEALSTLTRVRGERDDALADNDRLREQRDWAIGNSARLEQNVKDLDRRFLAEQMVQTQLYLENLKKRLGLTP